MSIPAARLPVATNGAAPPKKWARQYAWRQKNPERWKAIRNKGVKKWRETHPEAAREHDRRQARRWAERNRGLKRQRDREYGDRHRAQLRKAHRKWYAAVRRTVFEHYSGGAIRCAACGFENIDALVLDHVNNNGAAERRYVKAASVFVRLIKLNFPSGYQVLCANCNMIKEQLRRREAADGR